MVADQSIWLAALTLAALSAATPAGAQTTPIVHGTVTDARTGEPIPRARISIAPRLSGTNDQGRFALCNVPATTVRLVVEARGYRPDTTSVQLSTGLPAEVRIALERGTAPSAPPVYLPLEHGLSRNRERPPLPHDPSRIILRRPPHGEPERRLPMYFINGEHLFLGPYCQAPPPGVRIVVIDDLSPDDIEEIHVVRQDEARERFGPEGEHGAVFVTTRAGTRP